MEFFCCCVFLCRMLIQSRLHHVHNRGLGVGCTILVFDSGRYSLVAWLERWVGPV